MTEVPQQLLDLAKEQKPTKYTDGLISYYREDLLRSLNYEMVASPRGGPLSFDAFTASIKLEVATNDRLVEAMMASPGSFIKAVSLAAQCKLLVGGAYNLFYLIPRWNKKARANEVTPMIGYKGLCDIAQRHPRVHKIESILVYEGERWEYDAGSGKMTHMVSMTGDRSVDKIVGGYARVVITEPASSHPVLDDPVIHVMNREEIDAVMKRSDAYRIATEKGWNNSPWHTDYKPMARKTLIRAVLNGGSVPKDMGVGAMISAEDSYNDAASPAPRAVPRASVLSGIRQELGIDEKPAPFDFAEEAIEAIKQAGSKEALEALRDRMQHFEGQDATDIGLAYEDRLNDF